MNNMVNLAANYGWGPQTLLYIFIITVAIGAAGLLIVMATTRMRPQPFVSKKKYHFERYWAIGVAAVTSLALDNKLSLDATRCIFIHKSYTKKYSDRGYNSRPVVLANA